MVRYGLIALFAILALVGGIMVYLNNFLLGALLLVPAGLGIGGTLLFVKAKKKAAVNMEEYVEEMQTRDAKLPSEGPYAQVTYDPTKPDGIHDMSVGYTEPNSAVTQFRPVQMLQESGRELALAHKNQLLNDMIQQIKENIADPGLRQQAIADAMKYLGAQPEIKGNDPSIPAVQGRRERRRRRKTKGTQEDPFDQSGGSFLRRRRRYD